MLFPRDLAVRVGGLNERNHYTMDYELWGKFLVNGAEFSFTEIAFGCFRLQPLQKTQNRIRQTDALIGSAVALVNEANCLAPEVKGQILAELAVYKAEYPSELWRGSGRLATIGLPRSIVTFIRTVKDRVETGLRHYR